MFDQGTALKAVPDYRVPYNQIVRPRQVFTISQYFLLHWLPLLTPTSAWLIIALQQRSFWNHRQEWCVVSQDDLANDIGLTSRSLRDVAKRPYIDWFIMPEQRYRYDAGKGRKVRDWKKYSVYLDDPLSPEHQAGLAALLQNIPFFALERVLEELINQPIGQLLSSLSAGQDTPSPCLAKGTVQAVAEFIFQTQLKDSHVQHCDELQRRIIGLSGRGPFLGTQYFRLRWVPLLGCSLAWLVVLLRNDCYFDPKTQERRDQTTWRKVELARALGQTPRNLLNLIKHPHAGDFFEITDNTAQTLTFQVKLWQEREPLIPADRQKLVVNGYGIDPESGQLDFWRLFDVPFESEEKTSGRKKKKIPVAEPENTSARKKKEVPLVGKNTEKTSDHVAEKTSGQLITISTINDKAPGHHHHGDGGGEEEVNGINELNWRHELAEASTPQERLAVLNKLLNSTVHYDNGAGPNYSQPLAALVKQSGDGLPGAVAVGQAIISCSQLPSSNSAALLEQVEQLLRQQINPAICKVDPRTLARIKAGLDQLGIKETTRSKLAALPHLANPGYLDAWLAWYPEQKQFGLGWVIRQLEAGLWPPGPATEPGAAGVAEISLFSDPVAAFVAQRYEEEIGAITASIRELILEATSPEYDGMRDADLWDQAFRAAAGANVKKWNYVLATAHRLHGQEVESSEGAVEAQPTLFPAPALNKDEAAWEEIKAILRPQMTRATFDTIIRPAHYLGREGNTATIAAPEMAKEWLENRLNQIVLRAVRAVLKDGGVEVKYQLLFPEM